MTRRTDRSRRAILRRRLHVVRVEQLERRFALAAGPVPPNTGSIVASQFQPYGYSLLGTQLSHVTTGGGSSLTLTAPNNSGTPAPPPADYRDPTAPVNTGLITGSQVNVGGFTTLGLQLDSATFGGAVLVDLFDEGIGRPAAGGTQPAPVGGANPLPQPVPPGTPGVVTNAGIIDSSQFNDGGFGPLGIQASGLTVTGGLAIVSRNTIGEPDVPLPPPAVPFSPAAQTMPVNVGTIRDSQFADGGFGDTGLQLRTVTVGGSINVAAERHLIQPTSGMPNVGPPVLVGRLTVGSRVVRLAKPPAGSAPPTSMLYPGMLVSGDGIAPKTVIRSIVGPARITLSTLPRRAGSVPMTFFAPLTATNTGSIISSQFADGGFGDIGLQWSNVKVDGGVATRHAGLAVQPETNGVGSITTGNRQFGLPIQPAGSPQAAGPLAAAPAATMIATTGTGPAGGATTGANSASNSASNSGRIVASQFADGGFGDIGLQWQNVHVTGNVTATHNTLSIQPENSGQGLISVADVSFAPTSAAVAPAALGPGGPLASASPITSPGVLVTPRLPVPTAPARSGYPTLSTNAATNSGLVSRSQFADGGFGDVGLQWSNVTVRGDVQVVHNSLSIQPTGSGLAGVSVQNIVFGAASTPAGDPRLAPATLAPLTVASKGAAGPPPFVPNNAYARKSNTSNLTNKQFQSGGATATSLQWRSVTRDASGLVIVNNVLKVSNTGTAGTKPGARAGAISLGGISFPGSVPPRPLGLQAASAGRRVTAVPMPARPTVVNAASNSGTLQGNQFLDGGTGDIGLQWRGVTVNGSVRIEHNSCSINVVGDAADTGPIVVSGIRFDSGWSATGAVTDTLLLTPPLAAAARPGLESRTATAAATPGTASTASNSGTLQGGQFLDGGMGQIGLQWQQVTINSPIRIVNNTISVTVSGTNTRGVSVQDVTFV